MGLKYKYGSSLLQKKIKIILGNLEMGIGIKVGEKTLKRNEECYSSVFQEESSG